MAQASKAQPTEPKLARDHARLLLEINNAIVSHLGLPELLRAISLFLSEVSASPNFLQRS